MKFETKAKLFTWSIVGTAVAFFLYPIVVSFTQVPKDVETQATWVRTKNAMIAVGIQYNIYAHTKDDAQFPRIKRFIDIWEREFYKVVEPDYDSQLIASTELMIGMSRAVLEAEDYDRRVELIDKISYDARSLFYEYDGRLMNKINERGTRVNQIAMYMVIILGLWLVLVGVGYFVVMKPIFLLSEVIEARIKDEVTRAKRKMISAVKD